MRLKLKPSDSRGWRSEPWVEDAGCGRCEDLCDKLIGASLKMARWWLEAVSWGQGVGGVWWSKWYAAGPTQHFRCDDLLLMRWCSIPQGGAVFKLQGHKVLARQNSRSDRISITECKNSKTDARAAFQANYSSLGDSSIRAGNKNWGKLRKNFKPQPHDRRTYGSRLKPDVRNMKKFSF